MHVSVLESLTRVPAEQWNALAGDNPFLRHEFLTALERSGCVGGVETGWSPCHLLARTSGGNRPVGAVPLYLKQHSYGEYVFDWAWADAYARYGHSYYPKLVATVPFTPATGPRLLIAPGADASVATSLIEAARELAGSAGASSLHWLFPTTSDVEILTAHGFLTRTGCQFHWSNPGYRDFDDFLSTLTARKRSNVRRERRQVQTAGIATAMLRGAAITSDLWDRFYDFYRATIRHHGGIPYLTREFFYLLSETMPNHVVLVVALRGRDCVGAAFCLRGANTLYGRYWGGRPDIPGLHFETCYYTAIEYCIAEGIKRYEAGAQGEHKIARGFVPTPTYSAHWLREPALRGPVADYLKRERKSMELYMDELHEHLPFHARPEPAGPTS